MTKRVLLHMFVSGLIISSCLVGCGTPVSSSSIPEKTSSITLNTYDEAFDIHSELQKTYLNIDNTANQDSYIDGKKELSHPNSIKLEWTDSEECSSYSVIISETPELANPKRYFVSNKELEIGNLKIATKYYWRVSQAIKDGDVSEVGTFETVDYGPRNLYVDGVTNVRDVGGWMTQSNVRMKQGLLYRGARLNNSYPTGFNRTDRDEYCQVEAEITEEGKKVFVEELKIKTEIDLRDTNGNGYPGGSKKDSVDQAPVIGSVVEGVEYIAIPMDNSATIEDNKQEIKEFFDVISNEDNYPIYYHCNIGTNRTGMVSYLIGAICGMEDRDLELDYMFSNFGTIALPTPLSSNRVRTELIELTGEYEKNTYGAAYVVKTYQGNTLQEKAENCLKDCGVDQMTINKVKEIMLGA